MIANDTALPAKLGPYEITGLLGEGAVAYVLAAVEARTGRGVALKVLRPELVEQPLVRIHFHREANALMGIEHPNVIELYDYSGPGAEHPYIATEILSGETVRTLVERRGKIAAEAFRPLFAQVVSGLAAAHRAGLMHRDLSLENIFVEEGGRVVLTDFGLVAAAAERRTSETFITRGTGIVGTPLYFAPEVLRGAAYSARADVYSLGVCMAHALLGRPPYDTREIGALLAAIIENRLLSATSERTDVDPQLLALVDRCRAHAPKDRPASAGELEDTLRLAREEAEAGVAAWLGATAVTRITAVRQRTDEIRAAVERNDVPGALSLSTEGRYELCARLGAGGMGQVFLAQDLQRARRVAIKTLLLVDDESRRRFHREARALARLRHDNIVEIYDYSGRDAPLPFLVLELVEGATLDAVLTLRLFPENIAAIIAGQLARALIAVHASDLVHRDIKPENVFADAAGRTVLADFGIVRGVAESMNSETFVSSHTAAIGTPDFASPEQIFEPDEVGPSSDLFSLGRLMQVMVARKPDRSRMAVLSALASGTLVELPETVSPEYRELVEALCARDPAARPSAAEAAEQIDAFLAERDIRDGAEVLRAFLAQARGADDTMSHTIATRPRPSRVRALAVAGLCACALVCASLGRGDAVRPVDPEPTRGEEAAVDAPLLPPRETVIPAIPPMPETTIGPEIRVRRSQGPRDSGPRNQAGPKDEAKHAGTSPPPPAVLKFITRPWAKVIIDDRPYGDTPELRLTELRPGRHTVRFEHPPFQSAEQQVDLQPGEQRELRVTLTR